MGIFGAIFSALWTIFTAMGLWSEYAQNLLVCCVPRGFDCYISYHQVKLLHCLNTSITLCLLYYIITYKFPFIWLLHWLLIALLFSFIFLCPLETNSSYSNPFSGSNKKESDEKTCLPLRHRRKRFSLRPASFFPTERKKVRHTEMLTSAWVGYQVN
jgi:hypothetical protein